MDEPENFVPPEISGESTSVAAPILDEAEDDVQENPLSILVKENGHIVKCAAEAVLYCGRQCIALRDHSEKLHEGTNTGNFMALMNVLAAHNQLLEAHLYTPRMRNAAYMFGETQNQLAEIIGKDIIQQSLVHEVREATFFTIMVDEVTFHKDEVMPLCMRFVDHERNIREEFLQFSTITRTTGEAIPRRCVSHSRPWDWTSNTSGAKGMTVLLTWQMSV